MSLTLTLPLQFESPQIPHDEEQTFGVVHVDPAPCQMPPAVPQLDCVKLRQPPEVKQHAPWGSGQLVDPALENREPVLRLHQRHRVPSRIGECTVETFATRGIARPKARAEPSGAHGWPRATWTWPRK